MHSWVPLLTNVIIWVCFTLNCTEKPDFATVVLLWDSLLRVTEAGSGLGSVTLGPSFCTRSK